MNSESIISDIVKRDLGNLIKEIMMEGWQRERIIKTYTRKVFAHPEGAVVHDADCGLYNIELGVCTCGLHHCLMASSEEVIKELYPKYYDEQNNECLICYMLQEFDTNNLYVKDNGEFVKVERPEPISGEKLNEVINEIFGKEDEDED